MHGIIIRVRCSSAIAEEAQVVLAAIKLSSEVDFTSIECTTNSAVVYDVLYCTKLDLSWNIKAIIVVVVEISSRLYQISFYHIPRQFNIFADIFIKFYLRDFLPSY